MSKTMGGFGAACCMFQYAGEVNVIITQDVLRKENHDQDHESSPGGRTIIREIALIVDA